MKYGFITKLVDFDGEKVWVAESTDLKGCIGQGDNIEDAISELAENEAYWLEIAEKRGMDIPQPSIVTEQPELSGKLTLRLGKRVHLETAKRAKEDGLSINQYIKDAVVTYNTRRSVESLSVEMLRAANTIHAGGGRPFSFSIDTSERKRHPRYNIIQGANYAI